MKIKYQPPAPLPITVELSDPVGYSFLVNRTAKTVTIFLDTIPPINFVISAGDEFDKIADYTQKDLDVAVQAYLEKLKV
jgi:hypothetical protein